MTNIDFRRLAKILDDAAAASQTVRLAEQRLSDARREVSRLNAEMHRHPVPGVRSTYADPKLHAQRERVAAEIPALIADIERLQSNISLVIALRSRAVDFIHKSGIEVPPSLRERLY